MSRSNFERYPGPEASRGSHLPGEAIDGEAEENDAPEDNEMSHEALSTDEAARRLEQMQHGRESVEDLPPETGQIE